jgi:hypothetical protein
MNITDKLRLELLIREQITKHGEDFYLELEKILSKISTEDQQIPPRGQSRYRIM